jgi:hypothetical protein
MEQMPAYQERQSKLLQRLTLQDDSAADKTVRALKKHSEQSEHAASSPSASKVNSPTVRAPAASGGDMLGLDDGPAPAATVTRPAASSGGSMLDDLMGGGPSAPAPGATVVKPSGGKNVDWNGKKLSLFLLSLKKHDQPLLDIFIFDPLTPIKDYQLFK